MYVFAGLGNPGVRYDSTRHNVGFEVIDQFARAHQIPVRKIKHKALIGEGRVAGTPVVLVKPQTYMNLSGESLQAVLHYYKVPLERLVVVYDDIDLETGAIRIRQQGRRHPQRHAEPPDPSAFGGVSENPHGGGKAHPWRAGGLCPGTVPAGGDSGDGAGHPAGGRGPGDSAEGRCPEGHEPIQREMINQLKAGIAQ